MNKAVAGTDSNDLLVIFVMLLGLELEHRLQDHLLNGPTSIIRYKTDALLYPH